MPRTESLNIRLTKVINTNFKLFFDKPTEAKILNKFNFLMDYYFPLIYTWSIFWVFLPYSHLIGCFLTLYFFFIQAIIVLCLHHIFLILVSEILITSAGNLVCDNVLMESIQCSSFLWVLFVQLCFGFPKSNLPGFVVQTKDESLVVLSAQEKGKQYQVRLMMIFNLVHMFVCVCCHLFY